jgi:hypothetical protein
MLTGDFVLDLLRLGTDIQVLIPGPGGVRQDARHRANYVTDPDSHSKLD